MQLNHYLQDRTGHEWAKAMHRRPALVKIEIENTQLEWEILQWQQHFMARS
jgi:hypothetical protein